MMINERSFTKSDRRVGELHYAVKNISDEAFDCVLKVAQSFALDDTSPGKRLVRQLRCVIHADGVAVMRLFWEFDGEPFLSDTYTRGLTGRWTSTMGALSPPWAVRIESFYEQKIKEIAAAVIQEY